MNAELIAVGSELVGLGRRDTNSDWLAERLGRSGFDVRIRSAVDDDVRRIASLVRAALERSRVVIVTGGLGPTEDDRTRVAVARALAVELHQDAERAAALREHYRGLGLSCGPDRLRQAERPEGASWIDNPVGSAPGFSVERPNRLLVVLPGVPSEMRAMFTQSLASRLSALPCAGIVRRTLKIAGRTESSVDRELCDLYRSAGVEATLLTAPDGLELHVRVRESDPVAARARIDAIESAVRQRLGVDLYGADDATLAAVVGELLSASGWTLASAESCTAGLLGALVTSVPGSSLWYRGGVIVYDDAIKERLLDVPAETLERHGAVSEAVARELASSVRRLCAADVGVGITGIAGPGGGSIEKPVGRVHVAIDAGGTVEHVALALVGDRDLIRRRAASIALDRLRRRLLEVR